MERETTHIGMSMSSNVKGGSPDHKWRHYTLREIHNSFLILHDDSVTPVATCKANSYDGNVQARSRPINA
jgi:hypothetical protein